MNFLKVCHGFNPSMGFNLNHYCRLKTQLVMICSATLVVYLFMCWLFSLVNHQGHVCYHVDILHGPAQGMCAILLKGTSGKLFCTAHLIGLDQLPEPYAVSRPTY